MELPPEKYSYKVMGIIMAMYLKKSVYHLLSKVSFIRNLSNRIALFTIN